MRTIEQVSDADIGNADIIAAVDPRHNFSLTVWGDDVVPPITPAGAPAHKLEVLEIECDTDDAATLDKIIELVKSARGHVSSRVPNPPRLSRPPKVTV